MKTVRSILHQFPLKDGGYEIKALFVNHYGIASDISSANYYIDISRPDAPYVTPLPGNYDKPVRIEVDVPDGCSVYYTMDKTEPTCIIDPLRRAILAPGWIFHL